MRRHCITILYHAIEKTVANTIKATCTWCMMGRLGVKLTNTQQLSCFLIS